MRKLRNTAIIDPTPGSNNKQSPHIHQPINWASIIIVVAVILFALLWMIEHWLVRLIANLGFRYPDTVFAMLIWSIILGLPATLLINKLLHGWANARHRRRMDLEQVRLDHLTQMHLLQQSAVADSRALQQDDKDLVALVTAIMTDVYVEGEFTSQGLKPWARRNAGSFVLTGHSESVGEGSTLVREAVRWLRKNRVILGEPGKERVNLEQYPNLAAIQRKLHQPVLAPYPALPNRVSDLD